MYLALHGRDSTVQRGPLPCARGKLKQGERDSRRHVYNLKGEKTTGGERGTTEIEDVASTLSETRKVKPVSAV